MKLVESMEILPTTMAVPFRVMQLRQDPAAGARDFAEVLMADPSLSARILALVNSAWFSPSRRVTRISDAVAMIGMGNLLPLVFAGSLAAVYNTLEIPSDQLDALWRMSLLKAVSGREYAKCREPARAEEAFLAGLLQDIGLAVMYASDPAAWSELSACLDFAIDERLERETTLFKTDHASVGGMLAQRLQVPEPYIISTRHHHGLNGAVTGAAEDIFTDCVRFAAAIPHQIENWRRTGFTRLRPFLQCANGPTARATHAVSLLEGIQREYDWLLAAVGDGARSNLSFREFIQGTTRDIVRCLELAVGEASMLATTFEERESKLKHEMNTLVRETDHDSLTELLNRRGFHSRLTRELEVAQRVRMEMGIGFVDLDNFKAINDTCGHDVGDQALKAAAKILIDALGAAAIVARLGGDEFAFALGGIELKEAQQRSEAVLQQLVQVRFDAGCGPSLSMSASIGLLWVGAPQASHTMADLLQRADQLMYDAKHSGKGKVVITPLALHDAERRGKKK
jgi:diguanylate cyclase (GGDEF)-like protein